MVQDEIATVLRRIPYGFYSITSRDGEEVNAMVLNWMTQISYEPRLLAIAVQKTSFSHRLISNSKVFLVNLFLNQDAEAIKPFTKSRQKNPEKMKGVEYQEGPKTGCPILGGAAAYIECRVREIANSGGDHDLFIGEVIGGGEIKTGEAKDTLTLTQLGWSYAG